MSKRYRSLNLGGRFWTPAWCDLHRQPRDIKEVRLQDGTWHVFENCVCEADADAVYQASIRRGLGLKP